jgi:hypothetical protein
VITAEITARTDHLRLVARGLASITTAAEVFINGAFNREKAANLKAMGHDPMELLPPVRAAARDLIFKAIRSGWETRTSRFVAGMTRAAEYVRDALKRRIIGGRLGLNTAGGRRIKMAAVELGEATAAYGFPPPFGIYTGKMLNSIQVRKAVQR